MLLDFAVVYLLTAFLFKAKSLKGIVKENSHIANKQLFIFCIIEIVKVFFGVNINTNIFFGKCFLQVDCVLPALLPAQFWAVGNSLR